MSNKKSASKKKSGKTVVTTSGSTAKQQETSFAFKAKPGTSEAILEAAAFAKKARLKNYARA